jgi:hypothetical protein
MKKIVETTVTLAMLGLGGHSILAQNTPPTVVCSAPVTVQCAPAAGAPVTLSATVSDQETNDVTVVWYVDGMPFQTNNLTGGVTAPPGVSVPFSGSFGDGTHNVEVAAADGTVLGGCTTTVTVATDSAGPVVTNVTANPSVLWPPNHKMRPIRLNVQASDTCGAVTSRVVSVTSSEPVRGTGAFDKGPDWVIGQGGRTLSLRAERSGKSRAGRTYTITVETLDVNGNGTNSTVTVSVPHDKGQGPFAGTKPAKKPKKKTNRR